MINKVILVGNMGQDPDVRHLESGSTVARFSVATNENYKDKSGEWQKITEWHNVVAWRSLAENVERNYKKGMQVYVEGKLTTRKWQDKDGNERRTTDIIANTLRILGSRESNASAGIPMPNENDEVKSFPVQNNPTSSTSNLAENSTDDDLPF